MSLLATVGIQASRALSIPFEVTQPDGTTLTLVLHGDEHLNWESTLDGTMVMKTPQGYVVANIDDEGKLKVTKQLAHNVSLRSASEVQLCLQQKNRHSLFFNKADQLVQAGRRAQISTQGGYCLHEGEPRVLVILANFSDVKFVTENAHATFDNLCNAETLPKYGENYNNLCSLRRYFLQCSHGKFNPQLDVVGPVDLPQTMEYYGKDGSAPDTNFYQFCRDAIAAVDDEVDFNDYDNDGDGKAELVCVIYAGYGQNISGNPDNTIWPKCTGPLNYKTSDDVKGGIKKVTVSYMNCGAELMHVSLGNEINGFGTFIHEFSHGMGLSDHYATDYGKAARVNNQTPEYWDLMDYGEHANYGYAPVPYTAWEQETMGWIEVEKLEKTQNITEMLPLMKGGKAYKFGNGANAEEWIYLENVQPRDEENQILGFVYGHGLLATHVAYASNIVSMGDCPNNTKGHPRVCVVPADSLVINGYLLDGDYTEADYKKSLAGDPFPGTKKVYHLDATMKLPNYKFYNGEAVPVQSLTNITETDGVISFTFNDGTPTGIGRTEITEITEKLNTFYDLQGRRVAQPTKGLYIVNGKIKVIK